MIVELHAKSDVGRVRRGNEDNCLLLDLTRLLAWTVSDGNNPPQELGSFELGEEGLVLVVSDGMGGALAGDVASRMAVEVVRDRLLEDDEAGNNEVPLVERLRGAIIEANRAIHSKSLSDARFSGMGATFTGAAVHANSLDLVQVGDSRAYLMRSNQIKLTTKDQSLVQQLVDVGQISEEEAETHMFRNVILQALGAQSEIAPVSGRVQLYRGDILLMCSDGLSGKMRAEDMFRIISEAEGNLGRACTDLVQEANARGGEDNITVILARFSGDDITPPQNNGIFIEHLEWRDADKYRDDDDTMEGARD